MEKEEGLSLGGVIPEFGATQEDQNPNEDLNQGSQTISQSQNP